MVRDLLKKPTCSMVLECITERNLNYLFFILTFGDWIITNPSSAALSRNLWIDIGEDTGFETVNDNDDDDDLDIDPFDLGTSMTGFILAEEGIGRGAVLVFSDKSLTTCRWNPPSWYQWQWRKETTTFRKIEYRKFNAFMTERTWINCAEEEIKIHGLTPSYLLLILAPQLKLSHIILWAGIPPAKIFK